MSAFYHAAHEVSRKCRRHRRTIAYSRFEGQNELDIVGGAGLEQHERRSLAVFARSMTFVRESLHPMDSVGQQTQPLDASMREIPPAYARLKSVAALRLVEAVT